VRARFHPVDVPPRPEVVEPVERLVTRAHEQNRELRSALDELDALRAVERGARWDAYPSLDLVGLLGGNGLAGDADTSLVDLQGGFGTTWDQVWRGDFPTWSIGVELSLPIGLREGRGERQRLQAEIERSEERIEGIRRRIEEEVRDTYRQIEHGARRLEIAEQGVEAAYDQVRIGIIEFDNGRTTAFELVRLGADLATAQQRLSDALVRTARAGAELRRLTAADLEDMRVYARDTDLEIVQEVER
jgi:outer membrane protein TolC